MSTVRVRAVLVDLDDTLYEYAPADLAARQAVFELISRDLGIERIAVESTWASSRARVKERLGSRASSHSRLLYLIELAHALGAKNALENVSKWERMFWDTYLRTARLHDQTKPFLRILREKGLKIAIVTDLTLAPQLEKLAAFDLFGDVDAVVASEETPNDKPAREIFDLAAARLGVRTEECVVVGDSEEKDGEGARVLGVPFFLVKSGVSSPGRSLEDIAGAIGT